MSRRWIVVALIFVGILISYIDRGNLGIAAPSIMKEFGFSMKSMGLLLSAFFWTYAAFQIPVGTIIDRWGIRLVYACAFVLWSAASAGIGLSRGLQEILLLRLLLGMAESAGPIASMAFIRRNFTGAEAGLPIGIYIAGQNLGPAAGTLLGTQLIAHLGWRAMFVLTGLGALVWLPGWLWFAPRDDARPKVAAPKMPATAMPTPAMPTPTMPTPAMPTPAMPTPAMPAPAMPAPAMPAPAMPAPAMPAPAIEVQPGAINWREVIFTRAFWAMPLGIFLSSYFWYFLLTWVPTYLTSSRGFSTTGMGQVLSVPLFAMAAVNIAAGWIADSLVRRVGSVFRVRLWFCAAGYIGSGALLLLLVLPNQSAVLPVLLVAVCATGVGNANYWAIAQHVAPQRLVGRAIGGLNTVSQIAGAAAPLITAWILGPGNEFGVALAIAGISAPLAAGCLIFTGSGGLEQMKKALSTAS